MTKSHSSPPHLEVLDDTQQRVMTLLASFVEHHGFYLAGGTGLALRLGHRKSVDFDWFRNESFDPVALRSEMRKTMEIMELASAPGTLHASIDQVRVTFLAYDYPLLEKPESFPELAIAIASPDDLAAMKLAALLQRGERKDLYDIDILMLEHGPLKDLLGAFERKFEFEGTGSLLRALTYFDEAEATPDPMLLDQRLSWERTRERLKKAVRDFASS
ncbi:MAG: hypothetical protein BMS9Abin37_1768 [Acidobacteriota bacterium]|nr:MAG: hypothetical protein BMS9Abin37_1768 [Acidobacteriota bacterium]